MLVAFMLSSQKPARFEFYDGAPDSVFCKRCGDIVDRDYAPSNLNAEIMLVDMVYTRDGHLIISQKFKELVQRSAIPGVDLIRVNQTPPLYDFQPRLIIPYDVACHPPRFENCCECCGIFESVIGPRYSCLEGVDEPIEQGIYRTDLEFASGREKHPIIIVGVQTAPLFKREKLRGLVLNPINKDV